MLNVPTHIKSTLESRGLRIEPATSEDLPTLSLLISDLMEAQPDFIPNESAHVKGLRLILENPARGRVFVLRNDQEILGMVNLLFTISTALGGVAVLMEDVIIHPHHRRQGFGSLMVDYVIAFVEEKEFKRITLLADKENEKSQAFFQKKGFELSGLIPMKKLF